MRRASRLILGVVLVISAGCAQTPTGPDREARTMTPDAGPSFDETCRGGWEVANGSIGQA